MLSSSNVPPCAICCFRTIITSIRTQLGLPCYSVTNFTQYLSFNIILTASYSSLKFMIYFRHLPKKIFAINLPFILLHQIWIVFGVALNIIGQGLVLAYPYCLLPALRVPDSPIKIDLETGSWLATAVTVTSNLGMLISSCLMDWFGRKASLTIMMIPCILGWITIYFSYDITTLMIGRVLGGCGLGSALVLGSTIVGEYTSPEHRGWFLGSKTVAYCVGVAILHVMSNFFDWRTVALLSIIPFVMLLICLLTWPESPSWLAAKGRYDESDKSFYWLRGRGRESEMEFEALIRAQKERFSRELNSTFRDKVKVFLKLIFKPAIIKIMLITFFGFTLFESCGRHTFPAYAADIIGEINGDMKWNSFLFTISIDMLVIITNILSCICTKLFNRRTVLFYSGNFGLLVLTVLSIYLFLSANGVISEDRPLIPLLMLVLYFTIVNIGCTGIPLTIFGEIFPLANKGIVMAVASLIHSIPLILYLKMTPSMLANFKVHGTFTFYGISMAVALLYLYFYLPETRNKTLQEIEEYFVNGKFSDNKKKISYEDETKQMI